VDKTCPTCKQTKPLSGFYRNRHLAGGYNNYCKSCWRQYNNARRARPEVRARKQEKDREYNNRPEVRARLDEWCAGNWANRVVHKAASHALSRTKKGKAGTTCTITREFVLQLWEQQQGLCYYTRLPMSRELYRLDSVSMDRLDSKQGYDPGNVVLTCSAINRAKSDHSAEDFLGFIAALKLS